MHESCLALNMFSQGSETLSSSTQISKAGSQEHCSHMNLQQSQMFLEMS